MLIGTFQHNMDSKGRVFIPSKFRDDLCGKVIITKGLAEPCLNIYPLAEWQAVNEKIRALPYGRSRKLQKLFYSSSNDLELDKQGRVVVPPLLRDFAGLTEGEPVMVIGCDSHVELWTEAKWKECEEDLTADEILEEMELANF